LTRRIPASYCRLRAYAEGRAMRRLMPMAALFRQGVLSSCRRRHEV
jgi:hypothetical protein